MAPWRAMMREGWERAALFTKFACFVNVFNSYVMEVTVCMGPSMMPTFNPSGDVVLLEHVSTKLDKLKAGDVVVAKSPTNPRLIVCKRIVGVSGDRVTIIPIKETERLRHVVVPKGHVWLQGDNIRNSTDSRHYGPVPSAMVKGKVFYKIWPPREWGPVGSRLSL
eukprot:TRINITY_DN2739_c0_g2_i1.p1 TRINITY_DN2739_c0_g2~~TRINITY_DN2739_c0_g2_i1.p1  ORF type:complete len:165 (-),score=0.96 TRINITY_DN2739_c0_g2_i1:236-730(-)